MGISKDGLSCIETGPAASRITGHSADSKKNGSFGLS